MDQGIAITAGLVGIDISCMMAIKLSDFFLFVTYIIILLVPIPGFLLVRFLVRFVLDIVVIRLPIQMV
jgi:hypothetical protein